MQVTTQAVPEVLIERRTFGNLDVGNVHDDDAAVIQSYTSEVQAPPTPPQETISPVKPADPPRIGRLITANVPVPHGVGASTPPTPVMVLQPDFNRKHLQLRIYSPTNVATDFLYVADDASKLQMTSPSANAYAALFHGDNVVLDDYTGPLYAWAMSATADMVISVIGTSS